MHHLTRTLAPALALGVGLLAAGPAVAQTPADSTARHRTTVAVIGDVPYGTAQEATFGDLVEAINADDKVRVAVHVGDIKSGSTTCTDERFAAVRAAFDRFDDPLVYTPGDNEWTDCHRVNNGAFNPLERLEAVRTLFFPESGTVLGDRPLRVESQPSLVEDIRWVQSSVAFATLHVVGSDNGLAPWSGLGHTSPTPEQLAEVDARIAAVVDWVDETFDAAEAEGLAGVVLVMQADTFQPAPTSGQQEIVDRIAERTAAFDGEVLLVQGDSHTYLVDHPLDLPNLTRIVVHGETLPFEYLRLTVDPRDPDLFSWERVQIAA